MSIAAPLGGETYEERALYRIYICSFRRYRCRRRCELRNPEPARQWERHLSLASHETQPDATGHGRSRAENPRARTEVAEPRFDNSSAAGTSEPSRDFDRTGYAPRGHRHIPRRDRVAIPRIDPQR